jgi:Phasin protein
MVDRRWPCSDGDLPAAERARDADEGKSTMAAALATLARAALGHAPRREILERVPSRWRGTPVICGQPNNVTRLFSLLDWSLVKSRHFRAPLRRYRSGGDACVALDGRAVTWARRESSQGSRIMTRESGAGHSTASTIPNPWIADGEPAEFVEIRKKRLEAMGEVQKGFLETLERMNRNWFERARSEADLASEFASKLISARSVPDATSVYQQWLGRQMEMFAEDSRHFLADGQKLVEVSTRFIRTGNIKPE